MNKKYYLAIIFFLCITPSFAQSLLTISPNPASISLNSSQIRVIDLNISNNHDFAIYNVSFEDKAETSMSVISSIPSHGTVIIPVTISTNEATVKTINSLVSYYYLGDFQQSSLNYNINITRFNFNPSNIQLKLGDSISFKNTDNISHTISNPSLFTRQVLSNETYSYTFNSLGNYTIQDDNWLYTMNVNVVSNLQAQQVHNPDFDYVWVLNLNSQYSETSITLELVPPNSFTLNNFQEGIGVLKITNTGNELAKNVDLSSDKWVTFNLDNFDLEKGTSRLIDYRIRPTVLIEEETNKNHNISIRAKSINSNEVSSTANVFVNLDSSLPTLSEFLSFSQEQLILFLLQHDSSYSQNLSIPLTQAQANAFFEDITSLSDKFTEIYTAVVNERTQNTEQRDENQKTNIELANFKNETLTTNQKNDERHNLLVFIIICLLVILIVVGGLIYYRYDNINRIRSNQDISRRRKII